MTHFLSTSAGLAENVLIFASMDGMRRRKAGALRAYLSSPSFGVNSTGATFRQYFNRMGRGRVGDEILLTFRANGDVGHRQPFAELDKPSLGQKILLRRTLKKIDGQISCDRHRRPADAGMDRDIRPEVCERHHRRSRNRST